MYLLSIQVCRCILNSASRNISLKRDQRYDDRGTNQRFVLMSINHVITNFWHMGSGNDSRRTRVFILIMSVNVAGFDFFIVNIRSAPGTKNMKNTCRMFARGFVIEGYSCILSVLSIISSTETNRSAFRWWLFESSTSDIWQKSRANGSSHRTCHWGTIVNIFLVYLHNLRKMENRARKI